MTEAVPIGELLHEEAIGLTEYPEDAYSRLDFASLPYLESGHGQTLYQQG